MIATKPASSEWLWALAFFCGSLALAGYTLWYRPLAANTLAIFQYVQSLQAENRSMRLQSQDAPQPVDTISHLPTFLARINELAEKNGVSFKRFAPDSKDPSRFELEMIHDYPTFLHFTGDLEALDLQVDHLQVHPQDDKRNPPWHRISLTIRPRDTARPLVGERLEQLRQRVRESGRRNPFQKPILDTQQTTATPAMLTDLSQVFKLSGIGQDSAGRAYATINQKNYRVGDTLDGRVITDIQKGKVYLEKRGVDGVASFLIQYRKRSSRPEGPR